MVRHLVLIKARPEVTAEQVEACFHALSELRNEIPGLLDFCGGANNSPEALNRGYTHGFVMTFGTPKDRDAYIPHPLHQAAAQQLLALTEGGAEGLLVVDV